MVIYSKAKDDADDDLQFRLKRSIAIVKEIKMGSKKNGKKKGERATVSRERRLALAIAAIRDELDDKNIESVEAVVDANTVMFELGYDGLMGVPKRIALLNAELKAAVDAGDGKEISRLGLLIDRVKAGKDVETPKAAEA